MSAKRLHNGNYTFEEAISANPPARWSPRPAGSTPYSSLWNQFKNRAGPVASDGFSDWVGFVIAGQEHDRDLASAAGASLAAWASRAKQPNKVQYRVFEDTPGKYVLWARWMAPKA